MHRLGLSLPTFRRKLLEIRNYVGMCFKPLLTKKKWQDTYRVFVVYSNFVSEIMLYVLK
jgi:hypothetical protein